MADLIIAQAFVEYLQKFTARPVLARVQRDAVVHACRRGGACVAEMAGTRPPFQISADPHLMMGANPLIGCWKTLPSLVIT